MEKVVGPLPALVVGFALSDLVLVVRKSQVDTSGVDVQLPPEYRAKQNKLNNETSGGLSAPVRLTARLR